jgi:hypothetical protein
MPLSAKGEKIEKSMEKTYGSKEKAEQVLYTSKNKGTITGIDSIPAGLNTVIDAVCSMCDSVNKTTARLGSYCDDHRVIGGVGHDATNIKVVS